MRAKFKKVIGGKLYNTETALLIADDEYWDGSNHSRHGRNTHLYRTKNGNYFVVHSTCWQGERNSIEPIDPRDAVELYERLEERVAYEIAFPDATLTEA